MNCSINSASNFSGLQAGMSPVYLVQLAGSLRKFSLNRPFILPILELYKGSGLNDDEVFCLVGYGLESGTQSRPLGLSTALRDEDDSDGNAVYWTPGNGVTLEDFERISNGSFSQAVIDAIQDGDADNGEEEAPGTAEYAALLDTSGTASVAFFDSNYQLITS